MSRSTCKVNIIKISPHDRKWQRRKVKKYKRDNTYFTKNYYRADLQTIDDYILYIKRYIVPEYQYPTCRMNILFQEFLKGRAITEELIKEFAINLF